MRQSSVGLTRLSAEYGKGVHTIELGEHELASVGELKEKLLGIFRAPGYQPPVLPAVALELTELTRKNNVSYDEVGQVLQQDPMIVANVLKVAQSPLYGARGRVQSLREALNRLGTSALRDIVWQVVANLRLFRVKAYAPTMMRLQTHSVLSAYVSRMVAAHAGVATEHAFLCGLLHDIGISGTLIALSDGGRGVPPAVDTFAHAMDVMHAEASGTMARMWGLAPEICDAIGRHHDGDRPSQPTPALVSVLCIAERFIAKLDGGISPLSQSDGGLDAYAPARFEEAVGKLRLGAKLATLEEHALQIAQRLGAV